MKIDDLILVILLGAIIIAALITTGCQFGDADEIVPHGTSPLPSQPYIPGSNVMRVHDRVHGVYCYVFIRGGIHCFKDETLIEE